MRIHRRSQGWVGIVVLLAALLCMSMVSQAGNLEPNGPPTSGTMHSLEDIYQLLSTKLSSMEARLAALENKVWRFTDNNNGTATDKRTGLVWLKNANPCDTKSWAAAGIYCSNLASGQAGLTDGSVAGQWRLPAKEELEGIGTDPPMAWESDYPSVNWTKPGEPFLNVKSDNYWSCTSYTLDPSEAWYVIMYSGGVYCTSKSQPRYVWPVRGGN